MTSDDTNAVRRRVRLVILLDAAEAAGLVPIKILSLHAFAYLSNVLAPVWELPILQGSVLKRQGGPFYPDLQRDLDRLVGIGVADISGVRHVQDESKRWRLEGSYRLNRQFGDPILEALDKFAEERHLSRFVHELGYALSALSDKDIDKAFSEDATYSNRLISEDNVIEFERRAEKNYSANAARAFSRVIAGGNATSGEKLHLYVRHLRRRMHGDR